MTDLKERLLKVKKSNIINAGFGVFATQKYAVGDYICFYDAYKGEIKSVDEFVYSIKTPFSDDTFIGNKQIKQNDGVGQYINDGFCFDLIDDYRDNEYGIYKISNNKINAAVEQYKNKSSEKANCTFSEDPKKIFKIYASKEIDVNEELYLHYGIEYWITKIQLDTDESFTRLFCYLKNNVIKIIDRSIYFENNKVEGNKILQLLRIMPNGNIVTTLKLNNLSDTKKVIELIKLCS